jgi:glutathione S-transferase
LFSSRPLNRTPLEEAIHRDDASALSISVSEGGEPGGQGDEAAIARGEKALPEVIRVLDAQLAKGKWLLGDDFTLVECAYGTVLNVVEKAGFGYSDFPKVRAYLDAIRAASRRLAVAS